jgi:hypothetical protein
MDGRSRLDKEAAGRFGQGSIPAFVLSVMDETGPTVLSDAAIQTLAPSERHLSLNVLRELSDAAAHALGQHKGGV